MNYRSIFIILVLFHLIILNPFSVSAITVEISATVPGCGDNVIGIGEQCDGSNLGGSSCSSLGFSDGAISCTSACTFDTSQCRTGSSEGGGGGGGSGAKSVPLTNVVFTGRAYPLSRVTILKDAQIVLTTIAGPDSNFSGTISGLSKGDYIFSVYGEDSHGLRSSLFSFPIYITSGVTTKIGGIFIAPTITTDKSEVKKGDNITIFGQSVPSSEITISVNSPEEFFIKRNADATGAYLLNFDSSVLEMGQHQTKSKSAFKNEITEFGKAVSFIVGTENISLESLKRVGIKGDINSDGHVNLVDFSIAVYWYKRFNPPTSVDLNSDQKVDLVDFSIMAFNWTG